MKLEVFKIAGKDFVEFEEHQDLTVADVYFLYILPAWAKIRIAFLVGDEDFPDVASSDQFIEVIPLDRSFRGGGNLPDCVFQPLFLGAVGEQWFTRNAELERVAAIALQHKANFPFLVILNAHRREEENVLDLDRTAVGMFFKSCSGHLQVSDARQDGRAADAMFFENPVFIDAELRQVNVLIFCLWQPAFQ